MKLLYKAKFYALDRDNSVYSAVLIDDSGIILETYKESPTDIASNIEKIDLGNSYVFPGFTDAHTHSFEGGLYNMCADLQAATSIAEVLELISASPVIGNYKFAFGLDENSLKEGRFPTREELDRVVPNNPLLLRRVDGHSCVVNSRALDIINLPHSLPSNFTGLLRKEDNDIAAHTFHNTLTDEAILRAYHSANDHAIKSGLTSVHTMIGDAQYNFNHYPLIQDNLDNFDIHYELYPQSFNIEQALSRNATRIGGCILADGSLGSHTAAISVPYLDAPDCRGNLYQTDKFWQDYVWEAHKNNLQVGVHCIGDRAIEQVVDAYVLAQKREPKDLKHMIIHNEMMSDATLEKMKTYNIAATMQPTFDRLWGGKEQFYAEVLGVERSLNMNRFKSIWDSGVLLTGSSDWYVTTLNVLEQMQAAISHHNPAERLSIEEALRIYTNTPAILAHDKSRGYIAKGMRSEFTVLEKDPFKENNFSSNKIKSVIIGTKIF